MTKLYLIENNIKIFVYNFTEIIFDYNFSNRTENRKIKSLTLLLAMDTFGNQILVKIHSFPLAMY